MQPRPDSDDRLWSIVTILYIIVVALIAAHDIDHVVEEDRLVELPTLFWVFLPFQYAVLIGGIALVLRRDAPAPDFVAALSAVTIVGFAGIHLVPGSIGPYADYDPSWVSWTLVFVPIAAALACLVAALRLRAAVGGGGERTSAVAPQA